MQDEATDPAWQLLARAPTATPRPGFADELAARARVTPQDIEIATATGFIKLLSCAPPEWRAAAAAVVVLSAAMALLGVLSAPGISSHSAGVDIDASVSIAVGEHPGDRLSGLIPIEEALAVEALDALLQIEDSEALDQEDLLLLLVPDWELL